MTGSTGCGGRAACPKAASAAARNRRPRLSRKWTLQCIAVGLRIVAIFIGMVLAMPPVHAVSGSLPVIEPDPSPHIKVPKGYSAYVLRDWHRYVVIRAQSVDVHDDDLRLPGELFFVYGIGDGIRVSRRPKYPGELSHVLLPSSYALPEAVKALRAPQPPTHLPPVVRTTKPAPWLFEPEPLPASAPRGARAYRAVIEGVRVTGTVLGIDGTQAMGFSFSSGSNVRIRRLRPGDDPISHIIVPAGHSLPSDFLKREP